MKGAQKRIFYGIVLLSMLLSALYLALRRGAGLEAFVFDGGGNLIGDFVNNLHYPTHEGGPYFDSCWASFPPLAYTVYYLINVCITRAIYPFEVMVYMAITALSCMLMLGAVERIFRRWRPGGFRPGEPLALCVCLLLSGVMVYTIERGNSALNVMVMILWAFALRDGERPWERELALLLIAVAAGFKVYPCIFGLLYLFERRWREAARLVVYGVALFFVPFLWFGGLAGLRQFFLNHQEIHGMLRDDYLTSLPSAAGYLAAEFGWDGAAALAVGKVLAALLAAAELACIVLEKRLWLRCLLMVSLFILVPGWSAEYMAVYMALPLVLCVCQGGGGKLGGWYMALFGLIFVLLPFGTPFETHVPLSWNMLISFAAIYLISLTAMCDTLGTWLRARRGAAARA